MTKKTITNKISQAERQIFVFLPEVILYEFKNFLTRKIFL